MAELVRRVELALSEPWQKQRGRRRLFLLYRAVEIACMYLRHNSTQEQLADLHGASQPSVSRIVSLLVPIIKDVLSEFVPDPAKAITFAHGRVCLVDGTITPCWSYKDHPELWSRKRGITGFNVQLISMPDGTPLYISDPLPGRTNDVTAFRTTPVKNIVQASGGIGDKGYQGTFMLTPTKKPKGGQISPEERDDNTYIAAVRAPIERTVAHFKAWRTLYTDYRRPHHTYQDAFDAVRGLFFFSREGHFE
jgi:DDE superfamily endonuclease/Helix-turn-helix of DDE superfamily endonuclease